MSTPESLDGLRRFARRRRRATDEECDLCSAAIAETHRHLLDPAERKIVCTCDPCALLFSGQEGSRYRRVPADVRYLPQFALDDAQWLQLAIPIDLAFFYRSTPEQRVVAMYPSPAGATESLLGLDAWDAIVERNPVLAAMEPDVEALLVNRIVKPSQIFLAPIDRCYALVGLIRKTWRGLSGGSEMWTAVAEYFVDLKRQAHA